MTSRPLSVPGSFTSPLSCIPVQNIVGPNMAVLKIQHSRTIAPINWMIQVAGPARSRNLREPRRPHTVAGISLAYNEKTLASGSTIGPSGSSLGAI